MDKDLLLANIEYYCREKKIKPTPACEEAGVGRSFMHDIKRGRLPSIAKVAEMAAYLGVSTSDLVGDARDSPEGAQLLQDERDLLVLYRRLNEEGQEKALDYIDDIVSSGKYIKSDPAGLGKEA